MVVFTGTEADTLYLLSTQAIRDRAKKVYDLCEKGKTAFIVDEGKIRFVAEKTAEITRKNYPNLNIPFHSRWKHFDVDNHQRVAGLNQLLSACTLAEKVRAKLDLVIVSVLLDAGAGMAWQFHDRKSGKNYSKSEGLAVASLEMFLRGAFSSDPQNPWQVDSVGLQTLSYSSFQEFFQVSEANPLVGCQGRYELLQKLGQVLEFYEKYFGAKPARPGFIFDYLARLAKETQNVLQAHDLLSVLQRGLSEIWPGQIVVNQFNLGDAWVYPPLGSGLEAIVPFHKLSQWLSYSLVDPLVEGGLQVEGFEQLTALAEYRNGGLLVDGGVLQLKYSEAAKQIHVPASEFIVEWRALTVVLLERVADEVRRLLGKSPHELPLGKVLEGGTWWAGRLLAREKRIDGGSPFSIKSDGTVF